MTFSSLGLIEPLQRSMAELGHHTPTAVQALAITPILAGRDVLVTAPTGSGKTACFVLPITQRLDADGAARKANSIRALILVPTRELAQQVLESLQSHGKQLSLRSMAVYGGVSINPQMQTLRPGIDILVATPGRLLDLLARNALSLAALSILVLDEADRMLDLGFAAEWREISAQLPAERQNLLFSATFPAPAQALAEQLLRDPLRIAIAPRDDSLTPDIQQRAIAVDHPRRTQLLCHLLQQQQWPRVLVFVESKHRADMLANKLEKAGIQARAFHAEHSQGARNRALAAFKASKVQVLIATDIAARGLDIEQLPVVVNYDLPRSAVDYTHRIGRTGRAGASGIAISFICADNEAHFRLIEKRQQLRLEREQIAGFEPTAKATPVSDPHGGAKGKRMSKKDKLRAAASHEEKDN